jgi:hypothetical protein
MKWASSPSQKTPCNRRNNNHFDHLRNWPKVLETILYARQ